jgi:uncharacterized membrane protein
MDSVASVQRSVKMLKTKPIRDELLKANIDELDKRLLWYIRDNSGIRQVELATRTGQAYSVVHYRLRELERLNIIQLVRGRKSLSCYPGPNFFLVVEGGDQ